MIDNKLLEYLVVFSKTGSLLKTSELLYISQPSLTKGMQKLENELGIKIFERTGNKITLNENGLKILPYAIDIVNMNENLINKAEEIKKMANKLSIGYTAPGPMFKYPSLFLSNTSCSTSLDSEEELIKGINNNKFDLVFINHFIDDEKLICKKVMTEHLYISIPTSHFLSGMKDGVYWKDIDGQTFLLYYYIGCWHDILNKNLKKSRYLNNYNNDDLKEIVENSSIPSFITNQSMQYRKVEGRINIPILDKDSYLDFYVLCKKEKAELLNKLK